jgi:uncharacterized cupredoxin-like copper-binding protein
MVTGSRRVTAIAALVFVGLLIIVASGSASARASGNGGRALGPGPVTVRIVIDHSRFSPSRIVVRPHTDVRFVVVNRDFLNHEFIIGDASVHARHESGHEARHPSVPGEVSIAPHTTGVTTYTLHSPGTVLFACHLPGHFAYGMKGTVVVRA